jgi:hypothetical protein
VQRERKSPAVRHLDNARAHLFQRIEHASHRPATQGFVAVKCRGHWCTGYRANCEPRAGARIAEIELARRLSEAPNADAMNAPGPVSRALHACAEDLHHVGSVQHVLAFEHA